MRGRNAIGDAVSAPLAAQIIILPASQEATLTLYLTAPAGFDHCWEKTVCIWKSNTASFTLESKVKSSPLLCAACAVRPRPQRWEKSLWAIVHLTIQHWQWSSSWKPRSRFNSRNASQAACVCLEVKVGSFCANCVSWSKNSAFHRIASRRCQSQ